MRTMTANHLFLLAAGLVVATGCGPSNANLLAENRPRDAMCRMSSVEEAQAVLPRFLAEIQAEWRVRKLQREEVPGAPADSFERNHFVAVEVHLLDRDKKPTAKMTDESMKAKLEGTPLVNNRPPNMVGGKEVWVWPKSESSRVSVSTPLSLLLRHETCKASVQMKLTSESVDVETSDPQRFVPFSFDHWNGNAEVRVRAHEFLHGIHVAELTVPSPR